VKHNCAKCGQLVLTRYSRADKITFKVTLSNIRILFGRRPPTPTITSANPQKCRSEAVQEGVAALVPIRLEAEVEGVEASEAVVVRNNL
jgi:hypothetical protein